LQDHCVPYRGAL